MIQKKKKTKKGLEIFILKFFKILFVICKDFDKFHDEHFFSLLI